MRHPWTCQESVGNLGTLKLTWSKVLLQKLASNGQGSNWKKLHSGNNFEVPMRVLTSYSNGGECCSLSLGFMTKVRACKVTGQEGSPKVTSHVPGNAKECERMNLHTPKWTPILGIGIPMDSRIFRMWL
jgi:hypothetical protein